MVHSDAGTRAHARAGNSGGMAAPVRQAEGPDAKASTHRPPGAQAMVHFGDSVLQPWLRERKAQDLRNGQVPAPALRSLVTQLLAAPLPEDHAAVSTAVRSLCRALPSPLPAPLLLAILEATRDAALRAPNFASGCYITYHVLQGIDEVSADARGEQHLHRLLAGVLAFDEASHGSEVLFASWLRLVVTHISEEGLVPFVLHALDAHPPRSAAALADVAGHLALHALRELKERPDLVFLHMGQALSWLLRQDGPRRAEGLGGLGDGLSSSKYLSPRILCEVLQSIAAARDEIRDHKAGADVRAMMDRVAGAAGWRGTNAQGVLQALAGGKDAAPLPRDEALATVRGLLDATLHPGLDPQALAEGLLPWQEVLAVPVLSDADWVEVGRSIGSNLGGADIAPGVVARLVEGLAGNAGKRAGKQADSVAAGDSARSGAVMRGVVLAMGGKDIEDAPLGTLASALAQAPGASGWPLVLAMADALGALGTQRGQALPALRARLERLLPPPLPAALRTGLSLGLDPLATLTQESLPPAQRIAALEAAYAQSGVMDEALVEQQVWSCAMLAATDPSLALQAARLLVRHAGARVTTQAFRELRAALLPQARQHQEALADLYGCFAMQGGIEEPALAVPARKGAGKPSGKGAGRSPWQQRQAGPGRRAEAAAKFLREEAALLGRGLARTAFAPLALSLEALASELAGTPDRKR